MRGRKLLILLGLVLVFIWGNSMLPAPVSAALSGWVRRGLRFLSGGNGDTPLRKLAHLLEFAVLGLTLCWVLYLPGARKRSFALPSLLGGIVVGCVDEAIQKMVPGRGPSLLDVGIDTLGTMLGVGLFLLGLTVIQKLKNKKTKHD